MKAKEMFEKLEYVQIKENDNYIVYKNKKAPIYIEFQSNLTKTVKHINCYFKIIIFKTSVYLTLEELQAINKQVKELGWEVKDE